MFNVDPIVLEIADNIHTPCYVYFRDQIESNWRQFDDSLGSFPHQINYAVKANSNIAVLQVLAKLGSGFDIVSGGELERVLKASGDPMKIVFSGVGKSLIELERALEVGIGCFNVESRLELERLNDIACQMNQKASIAFRVNPDIDAGSHPYISTGLKENKFGINFDEAHDLYLYAAGLSHISIYGIACHIGSQITSLPPFLNALDKILEMIDKLEDSGITINHLNFGGGLGIRYRQETPPSPLEYGKAICDRLRDRQLTLHLEPGRAIVGNAGILLTRVEYIKENFAIVDAGMNDLLRPALYDAWQEIIPVVVKSHIPLRQYDVVGPVCESGDFLGKNRELRIEPNDLLAILCAGAYGFSMSSQYNSRPRAAEVMVDGNQFTLIRPRETVEDLFATENLCF